jgi:hypothetical protein
MADSRRQTGSSEAIRPPGRDWVEGDRKMTTKLNEPRINFEVPAVFANGLHFAANAEPKARFPIFSLSARSMSAYGLSWPSRPRCVICMKFTPHRSPLWSVLFCLENASLNWRCCRISDSK